jgi:Tol biopolymer transport system component
MTPIVFAPGIVSSKDNVEFGCTFSPDGKEFYFSRTLKDSGVIYVMKYDQGKWTAPAIADISSAKFYSEPHINHQGNQLFFTEFYLGTDQSQKPRVTISTVLRQKNGWSTSKVLWDGMYATTSKSGNIFYTNNEKRAIYKRIFSNGYGQPAPVMFDGLAFPTSHPFIAPDESFIIFGGFDPQGQSKGEWADLYVSFKQNDESFGEAVNLGDIINNQYPNICPMISPDGKYLFYSNKGDIYWVDSKIIEDLKPNNIK